MMDVSRKYWLLIWFCVILRLFCVAFDAVMIFVCPCGWQDDLTQIVDLTDFPLKFDCVAFAFGFYFAFKRNACDGLYCRRCAVLRRFALCSFALFCVAVAFRNTTV